MSPTRVTDRTVAILVETPTNPLMRIDRSRAMAEIAHAPGRFLIVDNTFATPFFQRPFESGADIVYHSTTKYLNGHSDMIGGIAVVRDDDLAERITVHSECRRRRPWPLRLVARAPRNQDAAPPHAAPRCQRPRVAAWLAEHVGERCVNYPGLPSHPQHALAKRQMRGFGGMVSVELGTRERAAHVLDRVRVFSLAESLGGVESLISHPASMTHASVPPDRRAALGITDGLIRLSCGVEDIDDLLGDLEQAFGGLGAVCD